MIFSRNVLYHFLNTLGIVSEMSQLSSERANTIWYVRFWESTSLDIYDIVFISFKKMSNVWSVWSSHITLHTKLC